MIDQLLSTPLTELTGSADSTYLEIPAGHVGLLAGSGARQALWPAVTDWLPNVNTPMLRLLSVVL